MGMGYGTQVVAAGAGGPAVEAKGDIGNDGNGNVQIMVRVRPASTREREGGFQSAVQVDSKTNAIVLNVKPTPRNFTFDHVAGEGLSQEDVFEQIGRPLTDTCLHGYNCSLIAYGQTGAGKTYTMEGGSASGENRGLIPRVLEYIFAKMKATTDADKGITYLCKVSYIEIYNEQVIDLLKATTDEAGEMEHANLTIREDKFGNVHVDGVVEESVGDALGTYEKFQRGSSARRKAETRMNIESSRSHSVFTLVVESTKVDAVTGAKSRKRSRFNLVDLAGSERQKSSQAEGERLKEAGAINKSLSALGNVIKALVDLANGKDRFVPYRDSKLTFILKDSLGGNSKCTMIANVTPAASSSEETHSTLKFAQRAKQMRNTVIVNEEAGGNVTQLQETIRALKIEISQLKEAGSAGGGGKKGNRTSLGGDSGAGGEDLESMLSRALTQSVEEAAEHVSKVAQLQARIQGLEEIIERQKKSHQSVQMIIKMREDTIKRLEGKAGVGAKSDARLEELKAEIVELKHQLMCHPDVVKIRIELDILKEVVKAYQENDDMSLAEKQERQVEEAQKLRNDMAAQLAKALESKTKASAEVEDMRVKLEMMSNRVKIAEMESAQAAHDVALARESARASEEHASMAREAATSASGQADTVSESERLARLELAETKEKLDEAVMRSEAAELKVGQANELLRLKEGEVAEMEATAMDAIKTLEEQQGAKKEAEKELKAAKMDYQNAKQAAEEARLETEKYAKEAADTRSAAEQAAREAAEAASRAIAAEEKAKNAEDKLTAAIAERDASRQECDEKIRSAEAEMARAAEEAVGAEKKAEGLLEELDAARAALLLEKEAALKVAEELACLREQFDAAQVETKKAVAQMSIMEEDLSASADDNQRLAQELADKNVELDAKCNELAEALASSEKQGAVVLELEAKLSGAGSEIDGLKAVVESHLATIAAQSATIEDQEGDFEKLQTKVAELEAQIALGERAQGDGEIIVQKLRAAIEEGERSVAQHEETIKLQSTTIEELEEELESAKLAMAELESRGTRAESEIVQRLEIDLRDAQGRLKTCAATIETQVEGLTKLELEVEISKKQLEDAKRELNSAEERVEAQKASLSVASSDLEESVARVEEAKSVAEKQAATIEELEIELDAVRDAGRLEKEAAEERLRAGEVTLRAAQEHHAQELRTLEGMLSEAREQLKRTTESESDTTLRLSARVAELEQRIAESEEQVQSARAEVEARIQEVTAADGKARNLQQDLENAKAEAEGIKLRAQADVDAYSIRAVELETKLALMEGELTSARAENEELAKVVAEQAKAAAEAGTTMDALQIELAAVKEEAQALEIAASERASILEQHRGQDAEVQKMALEAQQKVENLEADIEVLRGDLSETETQAESLRVEIEILKTTSKEAAIAFEEKSRALETTVETLQGEVSEYAEEAERLRSELVRVRNDDAARDTESEQTKELLREKEAEVKKLQHEVERNLRAIGGLQEKLQKQERQNSSVEEVEAEYESEIASLRSNLEELEIERKTKAERIAELEGEAFVKTATFEGQMVTKDLQLADMEAQVESAVQEAHKLRVQLASVKDVDTAVTEATAPLKEECVMLREKNGTLTTNLKKTDEELESLREAFAEFQDTYLSKASESDATCHRAEAARDELARVLETYKMRDEESKVGVASLEAEVKRLKSELSAQSSANKEVPAVGDSMSQPTPSKGGGGLFGILSPFKGRAGGKEAALERQRSLDAAEDKARITQLEADLSNLRDKQRKLQRAAEAAMSEADDANDRCDKVGADLKQARASEKAAKEKIAELEAQLHGSPRPALARVGSGNAGEQLGRDESGLRKSTASIVDKENAAADQAAGGAAATRRSLRSRRNS